VVMPVQILKRRFGSSISLSWPSSGNARRPAPAGPNAWLFEQSAF
jgi:hypothetical protein